MLGYIKKFVVDSFPSIIATIIGAYIVHHYVIPAAAPKNPASATVSVDAASTAPSLMSPDKTSFEKAVAEKSAIQKAAEKTPPESADNKRRHPAPRVATRNNNAASEATGSVDTGATEERRDANDLARAAIERLRNAPPPSRTVALAPSAVIHAADEPARAVPPMQPLPPAVAVTKGPDVFNGGAEAAIPSPPPRPDYVRPVTSKLTPPADIPGAAPIELHAEAQAAAKPSMAEDVMSAARSVFHAVVPR